MLRHVELHRTTGGGAARRRWRRALEVPGDSAGRSAADEPQRTWSLDEVGAAAIELGLFPESCLLDGQLAADRT